jgi:hypothetical protein
MKRTRTREELEALGAWCRGRYYAAWERLQAAWRRNEFDRIENARASRWLNLAAECERRMTTSETEAT